MNHLNRFTCEEAFRRLDDYLDRELAPDEMERVREHLEICEGCAREFRFEGTVIDNLRAKLRTVEPSPTLGAVVDDILARARRDTGNG